MSKRALILLYVCILLISTACSHKKEEIPKPTPQSQLALKELEHKTGIMFPTGSVITAGDDGGGRDPGFYRWVVFSTSSIQMPLQAGATNYLAVPLESTVKVIEIMQKRKISGARSAFFSSWETNNYTYEGGLVRAEKGDYLHIQQFIKK